MTADHVTPYQRLEYPEAPDTLEQLAAWFHTVYQDEARRQAGLGADTVRYPDEYGDLPEHTKDYGRALAIFVLNLVTPDVLREALVDFEEYMASDA